jgi:Fe-S-cluster-containing dehydrogenase component
MRNGIVVLNPHSCDGCGKCESVCPFQAISINTATKKADKCDMCYSRLQQNEAPVCVESCIAGAIKIGDIHAHDASEYSTSFGEFSMKNFTNPSTRLKYSKKDKIRIWGTN